MNLIFYGGDSEENALIDQVMLQLTGKENPVITYIPSCSYLSDIDFRDFVEQFDHFGVNQFINFPIDKPFSPILKEQVLKSDVIHLSGGNTYYFLYHLRKTGFLDDLKNYVKNDGILTGLSAGAIIMTPNINTAGFPEFDCDENDEDLKSFKSMGLVDFEFFPHYRNSKRYDEELISYSKSNKNPLYACPDGSGIVVKNDSVEFFGKAFCFHKGKKFRVFPG
jgi:dipeptidase E